MLRKIIEIDEDLCNGCGLCVSACHEGAIGLVDGKAKLLRDDYCDGLGDCLPACPTGAITFTEREAAPYDEAAVMSHLASKGKGDAKSPGASAQAEASGAAKPAGCPGMRAFAIDHAQPDSAKDSSSDAHDEDADAATRPSQIASWPIEIKLVPVQAPYFDGADLLVAADCTAFAYGDFHKDFMRDHVTIIGCPKLDGVDYAEKLAAILENNDIRSLTVARMQVPCCGGLENAARRALEASGKDIPFEVVTIACNGELLSRE